MEIEKRIIEEESSDHPRCSSDDGKLPIQIPRDRSGDFEPILVPKHQSHFDGFDDAIISHYSLFAETLVIRQIMKTHRNIPVSLADACLVKMAETHENSTVMTLESDFVIYRKARRKMIRMMRLNR